MLLFQKVITPDTNGVYQVNKDAAAQYVSGIPLNDLQRTTDQMNQRSAKRGTVTTQGKAENFGKCVITGVLGFSPFGIGYNTLSHHVKQKTWDKV